LDDDYDDEHGESDGMDEYYGDENEEEGELEDNSMSGESGIR
jgi:hypothetical protein